MTTFAFTGATQYYTVPANCVAVQLETWAAQAGNDGGLGGYSRGILRVTPGQVLPVNVGGQGLAYWPGPGVGGGGWNGGGDAYHGPGGGGASDVRQGGNALTDRVIVAGGGGGGSGTGAQYQNAGGGLTGGGDHRLIDGGVTGSYYLTGGGTQTHGGEPSYGGTNGTFGVGGYGVGSGIYGGGGGGGGWYGGGGGGTDAAGTRGDDRGGGGSGYIGGVSNGFTQSGVRAGNGQIIITPVTPDAPALTTPLVGETLNPGIMQHFAWVFSTSIIGDSQSAFDLRYRVVNTSTWKVVHQDTPQTMYDMPAGTLVTNASYEWQVRTYQAQGQVGPYSASSFFRTAPPPPGPVITSPVNGSTIGLSTGTLAWSTATQDAYRVRKVADLAGVPDLTVPLLFDTGEITSSGARAVDLTFPVNNRTEHLQVQVKVNGLWSPWASVRVLVAYTTPPLPTVVAVGNPATGSITLTVTHPTPVATQPAVAYMDVLRSENGEPFRRLKAALGLAPAAVFTDYSIASTVAYVYRVRVYGTNGTFVDSLDSTGPVLVTHTGSFGSFRKGWT